MEKSTLVRGRGGEGVRGEKSGVQGLMVRGYRMLGTRRGRMQMGAGLMGLVGCIAVAHEAADRRSGAELHHSGAELRSRMKDSE